MSVRIEKWVGCPVEGCGFCPRSVRSIDGMSLGSSEVRGHYRIVARLLGRRGLFVVVSEVESVMEAIGLWFRQERLVQLLGQEPVKIFLKNTGVYVRRDVVDMDRLCREVFSCVVQVRSRFCFVDQDGVRREVVSDGLDSEGRVSALVVE